MITSEIVQIALDHAYRYGGASLGGINYDNLAKRINLANSDKSSPVTADMVSRAVAKDEKRPEQFPCFSFVYTDWSLVADDLNQWRYEGTTD